MMDSILHAEPPTRNEPEFTKLLALARLMKEQGLVNYSSASTCRRRLPA